MTQSAQKSAIEIEEKLMKITLSNTWASFRGGNCHTASIGDISVSNDTMAGWKVCHAGYSCPAHSSIEDWADAQSFPSSNYGADEGGFSRDIDADIPAQVLIDLEDGKARCLQLQAQQAAKAEAEAAKQAAYAAAYAAKVAAAEAWVDSCGGEEALRHLLWAEGAPQTWGTKEVMGGRFRADLYTHDECVRVYENGGSPRALLHFWPTLANARTPKVRTELTRRAIGERLLNAYANGVNPLPSLRKEYGGTWTFGVERHQTGDFDYTWEVKYQKPLGEFYPKGATVTEETFVGWKNNAARTTKELHPNQPGLRPAEK